MPNDRPGAHPPKPCVDEDPFIMFLPGLSDGRQAAVHDVNGIAGVSELGGQVGGLRRIVKNDECSCAYHGTSSRGNGPLPRVTAVRRELFLAMNWSRSRNGVTPIGRAGLSGIGWVSAINSEID